MPPPRRAALAAIPKATTDYDAPRASVTTDDSLEDLQSRRFAPSTAAVDIDDNDLAGAFLMPRTDLLDEELTMAVIPMQTDEFRSSRCFLVHHRSQQADAGPALCRDCA